MTRTALLLAALTVAPACRITLEGEYEAPLTDDSGVSKYCLEAEAEPNPTATFLHANTFLRNCSGNSCHDSDQPEANLELEASPMKAREQLVDRAADEEGVTMMLVTPGEPAQSYLMLRVHQFEPDEMDPPQEAVAKKDEAEFYMPQKVSAGLCEGKRNAIQRWIENGAPL